MKSIAVSKRLASTCKLISIVDPRIRSPKLRVTPVADCNSRLKNDPGNDPLPEIGCISLSTCNISTHFDRIDPPNIVGHSRRK